MLIFKRKKIRLTISSKKNCFVEITKKCQIILPDESRDVIEKSQEIFESIGASTTEWR